MKNLELAILSINGENLRLEVNAENLPCEKLANYIIYCTSYDRWECKYTCKYAISKQGERG